MKQMHLRSLAAVVAVVTGVACGGDSTAPPKAASLTVSVKDTTSGISHVVAATDSLKGTVSLAVLPTPTFTVLDDKGNAISGVPVTVTVTGGGGQVTNTPKSSGSSPTSVGTWVLGSVPGTNSLTISVAGVAPVVVTAIARRPFFVDLRFFGPPIDASFQAAFTAAKARVEQMITADVPDTPVTALDIVACGVTGAAPITELVDDLIIYAVVDSIDGPGKILGSSGPCYQRTIGGLPLLGVMHFDVADFLNLRNDGRLNDVVLHEMLHVVGFGTMWLSKGQVSGAGTPSSAFIGAQATAGCVAAGGSAVCVGSVPLETTGGQGTRDVHWRETTFRTELMTGFVSAAGVPNPLSRMSIGSLGDIGYTVNTAVADAYTVPSPAAIAFASIREAQGIGAPFEINEVVQQPIGSIDPKGRVTPLSARRQ